jgi:hypothetical protein
MRSCGRGQSPRACPGASAAATNDSPQRTQRQGKINRKLPGLVPFVSIFVPYPPCLCGESFVAAADAPEARPLRSPGPGHNAEQSRACGHATACATSRTVRAGPFADRAASGSMGNSRSAEARLVRLSHRPEEMCPRPPIRGRDHEGGHCHLHPRMNPARAMAPLPYPCPFDGTRRVGRVGRGSGSIQGGDHRCLTTIAHRRGS